MTMAKIENVSQSFFGEGKSATRSVRPVDIPNPYAGAANALAMGARGLGSITGGLVDLAHKGQELRRRTEETELRSAQVRYNALLKEKLALLQKEYTGVSAPGALEALKDWNANIVNELCKNKSVWVRDKIREFTETSGINAHAGLIAWSTEQVNRAFIDVNNAGMTQDAKTFAATGNDTPFNNVCDSFNRGYFVQNGFITDAATMAALKKGYEAGEIPALFKDEASGKYVIDARRAKIKIGDKAGEMSKDDAKAYMAELERQHEHYTKSFRNQIDLMVAMRFDVLMKGNDFNAASQFIKEIDNGKWGPVTKNAKSVMKESLGRGMKVKTTVDSVTNMFDTFFSKQTPEVQKYGGAAFDADYAAKREEIYKHKWGDDEEFRDIALHTFDTLYKLKRDAQKTALASDVAAWVAKLEKIDVTKREAMILRELSPGVLRDKVLAAHKKKYNAFMDDTPQGLAMQYNAFGAFVEGVYLGKLKVGDVEFDLSTAEGAAKCVTVLGLSTANAQKAMAYYQRAQNKKIDIDLLNTATGILGIKLNEAERRKLIFELAAQLEHMQQKDEPWSMSDKLIFYKKFSIDWLQKERRFWQTLTDQDKTDIKNKRTPRSWWPGWYPNYPAVESYGPEKKK